MTYNELEDHACACKCDGNCPVCWEYTCALVDRTRRHSAKIGAWLCVAFGVLWVLAACYAAVNC
jgi:hypothetical protein